MCKEGRPRYSSTNTHTPSKDDATDLSREDEKTYGDVILIIAGMYRVMRGTQGAALRRKPTRQENAPRGISEKIVVAFAALFRESHPKSAQSSKALSKQTTISLVCALAWHTPEYMTSLLQKARESGTCPPSLIKEEHANDADAFQTEALGVVGAAGTFVVARGVSSPCVYPFTWFVLTIPLVSSFFTCRTLALQRRKFGRFV